MAVTFQPENSAQSQRLISSGGNIYTLATSYAKQGQRTRGRGFWAGRAQDDEEDPNIDRPDMQGANTLIPMTVEQDAALDDDDPVLLLRDKPHRNSALRRRYDAGRLLTDAIYGVRKSKVAFVIGDIKMDLLLQNPESLSEADLVKSANIVSQMLQSTDTEWERQILTDYAGRVAQSLERTLAARKQAVKALMQSAREDAQSRVKEAKRPPEKAQTTQVNTRGKVAYKYPKKGDGKGPNSDGWKGNPKAVVKRKQAQQDVEEPSPKDRQDPAPDEAAAITPPQPIDPKPFANVLGISVKKLKQFAMKKTRKEFVDFFALNKEFMQKHDVGVPMLGKLHDVLIAPPQKSPQQPPPASGPTLPSPGGKAAAAQTVQRPQPSMKSLVVFTGAILDPKMSAIVDMLKSHRVDTPADIVGCLQAHYACSRDDAERVTRSLLNKWERQGVVTLYPMPA